jgi:hypothetical protein
MEGGPLMPALLIILRQPGITIDDLGLLPLMIDPTNRAPAKVQLNEAYQPGGWRPMDGWQLRDDDSLRYLKADDEAFADRRDAAARRENPRLRTLVRCDRAARSDEQGDKAIAEMRAHCAAPPTAVGCKEK